MLGTSSSQEVTAARARGGVSRARLTTDVLFHPSEGDSSFFAAFTESQQEGAWGLGAQDGPLPLLTDEAHYVPGAKKGQPHCYRASPATGLLRKRVTCSHCALRQTGVSSYPSFQRAKMYFFTRSMILSSQTQKEKPLPAMFS